MQGTIPYIHWWHCNSFRVQVCALRENSGNLFQLPCLWNAVYLVVADAICMIYLPWYLLDIKSPRVRRTPEDKLAISCISIIPHIGKMSMTQCWFNADKYWTSIYHIIVYCKYKEIMNANFNQFIQVAGMFLQTKRLGVRIYFLWVEVHLEKVVNSRGN